MRDPPCKENWPEREAGSVQLGTSASGTPMMTPMAGVVVVVAAVAVVVVVVVFA